MDPRHTTPDAYGKEDNAGVSIKGLIPGFVPMPGISLLHSCCIPWQDTDYSANNIILEAVFSPSDQTTHFFPCVRSSRVTMFLVRYGKMLQSSASVNSVPSAAVSTDFDVPASVTMDLTST